jgi:type I restriction enzyme S subunit
MQADWPLVPLGTVAKVEMGQSPPSADVLDGMFAGLPFLQGNAEFGPKHPEPRLVCRRPLKRAYPGDSLISPSGTLHWSRACSHPISRQR